MPVFSRLLRRYALEKWKGISFTHRSTRFSYFWCVLRSWIWSVLPPQREYFWHRPARLLFSSVLNAKIRSEDYCKKLPRAILFVEIPRSIALLCSAERFIWMSRISLSPLTLPLFLSLSHTHILNAPLGKSGRLNARLILLLWRNFNSRKFSFAYFPIHRAAATTLKFIGIFVKSRNSLDVE